MKKKMLLIAASCLLMTSCRSNKVVTKTVVPTIDFPLFPKIERVVNPDGSWLISKKATEQLAKYYVDIQKTEKEYNRLKKLYENIDKE